MRKESIYKCSLDGCEKPVHGRSFCKPHYQIWYRTGNPSTPDQRKIRHYCTVDGCESRVDGNGYCSKHNRRFKKYGDPHKLIFEQHGMTKSDEYRAWLGIKHRCYRKEEVSYPWYGALGITMCDEWLNSFVAFYNHVGPKPGKGYDIDRIDSYGNYEPGNCQWITHKENCNKQRRHNNK